MPRVRSLFQAPIESEISVRSSPKATPPPSPQNYSRCTASIPPPNGKYANRGGRFSRSPSHRSGRNSIGASNHRGCAIHHPLRRAKRRSLSGIRIASDLVVFDRDARHSHAGGKSRIDSVITWPVYRKFGTSSREGAWPTRSTESSSAWSFASTVRVLRASSIQVHDNAFAVSVSCPARKIVIASSPRHTGRSYANRHRRARLEASRAGRHFRSDWRRSSMNR